MIIVYTIAFTLLVPILLVRLVVRGWRDPACRARWRERFGYDLPRYEADGAPIWIHAVSVGEAIAATPVVEYLSERHPDIPLLVTTTTATGAAEVVRRFGSSVEHRYFPYDLPWVVRRFLGTLRPRLLVLMETELWPHLLCGCARMNVPVIVANARLSQKSADRYARVPRLIKQMLGTVSCFAAQGEDDRRRFIALGAPSNSVVVTGSLKFDIELPASVAESGQALRRFLGVNRTVLMAGSTRDGEEAILLSAYTRLLARHPDALLLIAPRHPERFEAVADLCRSAGFELVRHSNGGPCPASCQIYLIDSMGELPGFYAASDVAFVGGSLVPRGGHNVLEPAALGIPVIVGRFTFNFSEIVEMLRTAGALAQVDDVDALVDRIDAWLSNGQARDEAGAAGRSIVLKNRGATLALTDSLDALLALPDESRSGEFPSTEELPQ